MPGKIRIGMIAKERPVYGHESGAGIVAKLCREGVQEIRIVSCPKCPCFVLGEVMSEVSGTIVKVRGWCSFYDRGIERTTDLRPAWCHVIFTAGEEDVGDKKEEACSR